MITVLYRDRITSPAPMRYPPEFRRKALDLFAPGRRAAHVATDLDIGEKTIYIWRRQVFINEQRIEVKARGRETTFRHRD